MKNYKVRNGYKGGPKPKKVKKPKATPSVMKNVIEYPSDVFPFNPYEKELDDCKQILYGMSDSASSLMDVSKRVNQTPIILSKMIKILEALSKKLLSIESSLNRKNKGE